MCERACACMWVLVGHTIGGRTSATSATGLGCPPGYPRLCGFTQKRMECSMQSHSAAVPAQTWQGASPVLA